MIDISLTARFAIKRGNSSFSCSLCAHNCQIVTSYLLASSLSSAAEDRYNDDDDDDDEEDEEDDDDDGVEVALQRLHLCIGIAAAATGGV